jgi:hypothetical protein
MESLRSVLGAVAVGESGSKACPPAVAAVSAMWQLGQAVSPFEYHVQQLRRTARLTSASQRTQRRARRKDCKKKPARTLAGSV